MELMETVSALWEHPEVESITLRLAGNRLLTLERPPEGPRRAPDKVKGQKGQDSRVAAPAPSQEAPKS